MRGRVQKGIIIMIKRVLCLLLCFTLVAGAFAACSGSEKKSGEGEKINIAFQYGMGYYPLLVMKEKQLLEKNYPGVTVEWTQLNSGAAVGEALTSGSIDAGAVGPGPAIINITAGSPIKIFSSISSMPMNLLSMDPNASLDNIADTDQIATVNIGSIQHICLAMAAEKRYGDAHKFDERILAMKHPDGMASLVSGSVKFHLTAPPYIVKEQEQGATVVDRFEDVWPVGTSFIVGVCTNKLHDEKPDLYKALCDSMQEAVDFINDNPDETAKLLCENEGTDEATLKEWLAAEDVVYSTETSKVKEIADFMFKNAFSQKEVASFSDLAFDNVKGN